MYKEEKEKLFFFPRGTSGDFFLRSWVDYGIVVIKGSRKGGPPFIN